MYGDFTTRAVSQCSSYCDRSIVTARFLSSAQFCSDIQHWMKSSFNFALICRSHIVYGLNVLPEKKKKEYLREANFYFGINVSLIVSPRVFYLVRSHVVLCWL